MARRVPQNADGGFFAVDVDAAGQHTLEGLMYWLVDPALVVVAVAALVWIVVVIWRRFGWRAVEAVADAVLPRIIRPIWRRFGRKAVDVLAAVPEAGPWRQVAAAPYGRASRAGPVVDDDGVPLHGWYARTEGGIERRVLVNHGAIVDNYLYPPGATYRPRAMDLSNCYMSQSHWAVGQAVTHQTLEVAARVASGRKPCGSANIHPDEVDAWSAAANAAGIDVIVGRYRLDGFVAGRDQLAGSLGDVAMFARREPFQELVDLDALAADYETMGVTGPELDDLRDRFARLASQSPADVLRGYAAAGRSFIHELEVDLKPASFAELGLLLGYDHRASAGAMLGLADRALDECALLFDYDAQWSFKPGVTVTDHHAGRLHVPADLPAAARQLVEPQPCPQRDTSHSRSS